MTAGAGVAGAATFVVNTSDDENDGIAVGAVSLREAIQAANATPGPDIIELDLSAGEGNPELFLSASLPPIMDDLVIRGNGVDIQANNHRGFRIFGGNVQLRDLRILSARATGGDSAAATGATGGAGAGLGAGLLIDTTGAVLVENVEIWFAQARGGFPYFVDGGAAGAVSGGGGDALSSLDGGAGADGSAVKDAAPGGTAGCPPTAGGTGGGGGASTGACEGGAGGFGGGGGASLTGTGGTGGYGGGGGGGATPGAPGDFGAPANGMQGGGGAGLGGGIFVRRGEVFLRDMLFFANVARGGGFQGESWAGQGKGADLFVHPDAQVSAFGLVFSSSDSSSNTTPGHDGLSGVFLDDEAIWGIVRTDTPVVERVLPEAEGGVNGTVVPLTVEFTQDVTGVDVSDFAILCADPDPPTITGLSGSGRVYTLNVALNGLATTFRLRLSDDNSITGVSGGRPLGGSLVGDGSFETGAYAIDAVAPTGAFDAVGSPRNSAPPVTIAFSERVVNFTAAALELRRDGDLVPLPGDLEVVYTEFGWDRDDYWTINNLPLEEGGFELSIKPGIVTDRAGNPLQGTQTVSWTTELTAPVITASLLTPANIFNGTVRWRLLTDEPTQPITEGMWNVSSNSAFVVVSNVQAVQIGPTEHELSADVSGGFDATVSAFVRIADLLGNEGSVNAPAVRVDNTPPTIGSVTADDPQGGANLSMVVNFSEPVRDLLIASQIEILAGSAVGGVTITPLTVGLYSQSYRIDFNGIAADGPVGIRIPAATVTDQVGLQNDLYENTSVFHNDRVRPGIASFVYTGTATPARDFSPTFQLTFTEPVSWVLEDFGGLGFGSTGTLANNPLATRIEQVGPAVFEVEFDLVLGEGDLRLSLIENAVIDPFGNAGPTAATDTAWIGPFDLVKPSVVDLRPETTVLVSGTRMDAIVDFSEPIFDFTGADVEVVPSGISVGDVLVIQLTPTSYQIRLRDVAGTGSASLRVLPDTVIDHVGNQNTGSLPLELFIENDHPQVAVVGLGGAVQSLPTSFTVEFDKPMQGLPLGNLSLAVDGVGRPLAGGVQVTTSDNRVYTVTGPFAGMSDEGVYTFTVIRDGLLSGAGLPVLSNLVVQTLFDNTRPAVSLASPYSGTITQGNLEFTATFTEAVTGFITPSDLLVSLDGVAFDSITITPVSASVYTVALSGVTGVGELRLKVRDAAAIDAAGLTNTEGNELVLDIENLPPVVTAVVPSVASPTAAGSFNYTISFSEPVTLQGGVSAADFFTTSPVLNSTVQLLSATEARVNVTIPGVDESGSGTVAFRVPAGRFVDADANGSIEFAADPIEVDRRRVYLSFDAVSPDPRATQPTNLTLRFTKPVINFSTANLQLTRGGTILPINSFWGNDAAISADGGLTWSLRRLTDGYTESGFHEVELIDLAAVTDALGNPLVAGNPTIGWTLDSTPPTVTVQLLSSSPVGAGTTASYRLTFSEPVQPITVGNLDILLTDDAEYGAIVITPDGSSQTLVDIGGLGGSGTLTLSVPANVVRDLVGNTNTASAAGAAVTIDSLPPDIVIFVAENATERDSTASFLVEFDEDIASVDNGRIIVNKPTEMTFTTAGLVRIDARRFRVVVAGIVGTGNVSVSLQSGSALDAVGNQSVAGTSTATLVDQIAPQLTVGVLPASTYDDELVVTIALSEVVTGLSLSNFMVVTAGLPPGEFTAGSALSYGSAVLSQTQPNEYELMISGLDGEGLLYVALDNWATVVDGAGNVLATPPNSSDVRRYVPQFTLGSVTFDISQAERRPSGPQRIELEGDVLLNGFLDVTTPAVLDANLLQLQGEGGLSVANSEAPFGRISFFTGTNGWELDLASGEITPVYSGETEPTTPLALSGMTISLCDRVLLADRVSVSGKFNLFRVPDLAIHDVRLGVDTIGFGPAGAIYQSSFPCAPETGVRRFTAPTADFEADGIAVHNTTLEGVTPPITLSSFRIQNSLPQTAFAGSFTLGGFPFTFNGGELRGGATLSAGTAQTVVDGTTISFFTGTGTGITLTEGSFSPAGGTATFEAPSVSPGLIELGLVTYTTAEGEIYTVDPVNVLLAPPGISAANGAVTVRGATVVLDETGRFDGIEGLLAESAVIPSTTGPGFGLDDFRVDDEGLYNTGRSFTIAGLLYTYDTAEIVGTQQGLLLKGELALPENLLGVKYGMDLLMIGDRVQLNRIDFCTPNAPGAEPNIFDTRFTLPSICFKYLNGPPERFRGSAEVGIDQVITVGAAAGIARGRLDELRLSAQNLNKPIGSTGAFLDYIIAEGKNISRLPVCENVSIREGNTVRVEQVCHQLPMVFTGEANFTMGPKLAGASVLSGNMKIEASESSFAFDGRMMVFSFITFGRGYATIVWSGPNTGGAFGGGMFMGVIYGRLDGVVRQNGYTMARGFVGLYIPDGIPGIGGTEVGGVSGLVEYDPNRSPSFKFAVVIGMTILPEFCVPHVGCVPEFKPSLTLTFYSDGSFEFDLDAKKARNQVAPWEVPFYQPVPVTVPSSNKSGEEVMYVSAFMDFDQSFKAYSDAGAFKAGGKSGGTSINLPITATSDAVVVRLTYSDPAGVPDFTLTSPSGAVITPADGVADIPRNDRFGAYSSNVQTRDAMYIIRAAESGNYVANVLHPETLGTYAIEVLTRNTQPSFRFDEVLVDQTDLAIRWTASDPDDPANIKVFLGQDRSGAGGIPVVEDAPEADGAGLAVVDLSTSAIPAGWYWPHALIDDGRNAPVTVVADYPIFIPSTTAPTPVTAVDAYSHGQTLYVTWQPVSDPDLSHYVVKYTDDPSLGVYKYSRMAPATATLLRIDGLELGREYRVTVVPVLDRTTKGTRAAAPSGSLAIQQAELDRARRIAGLEKGPSADLAELLQSARASRSTKAAPLVESHNEEGPELVHDIVLITAPPGQNNAPRFLATPPAAANVGELYTTALTVVDDDGDPITYSVGQGPAGFLISGAGVATWTPQAADAGRHEMIIVATDNRGGRTTLAYDLTVGTIYTSPDTFAITSAPPTDAVPGDLYVYTPLIASSSDTSIAAVVWSLVDGPSGMTINPATGRLEWTPAGTDTGAPRVILRARQALIGAERVAVQEFRINLSRISDQLVAATLVGDSDGDSIVNQVEDAAPSAPGSTIQPTGDANGDGELDSLQANVASFRNGDVTSTNDGVFVTLVSAPNTQLGGIATQPAIEESLDTTQRLPFGEIRFTLTGAGVVAAPGRNLVRVSVAQRGPDPLAGFNLRDGIEYAAFRALQSTAQSGASYNLDRRFTLFLQDDNGLPGDPTLTGDASLASGSISFQGGPLADESAVVRLRNIEAATTGSTITLSWSAVGNAAGVTYIVYRSRNGGALEQINMQPIGGTKGAKSSTPETFSLNETVPLGTDEEREYYIEESGNPEGPVLFGPFLLDSGPISSVPDWAFFE